MAESAQDKLTFLLSLVPYLIDQGRVRVADAAAHFAVEPETVREAVRLIAVSGVPGGTSQYQPEDLFDISWDDFEDNDEISITHQVALDDSPRFSAREASALIAGLQYLSALPENENRAAIGSLMAKLSRGASSRPSEVAVAASDTDESLALVRSALASGVQLEFDYRNSRGRHKHRRVDPLRMESADQDWYLRAWCHSRRAVRIFRIDRMTHLTSSDRPAKPHPRLSRSLPETLFAASKDDLVVTVQVPQSALPLLADYPMDGPVRVSGGSMVRVRLRLAHYHGLKRLVCSLPGVLNVLEPAEARAAVAQWAAAGVARYGAADAER